MPLKSNHTVTFFLIPPTPVSSAWATCLARFVVISSTVGPKISSRSSLIPREAYRLE